MKRIKTAKENVSVDAVELKEEELEGIVGGEMYMRDEEYSPSEGYWYGMGAGTCKGCGGIVKGPEIYSIKGFYCPRCGCFND